MASAGAGPRLAYVTGTYPVRSETFVAAELRELARIGEAPLLVTVVEGGDAPEPGAPPAADMVVSGRRDRDQAAALARLAARNPLRTAAALALPARRLGGGARDVGALAPIARELAGVQHIHAHFATQPAAVAGRLSALTGIPWSFTAHAWDIFTAWEAMEEKLRSASFCVAVCDYNRDHIARLAPDRADRVRVVMCGVDLELFTRSVPYDPGGPIVAVGRLVAQKGFAHLVRAAALARGRIPEIVIAGDGPERGALAALVAETGAPVRMVGAIDHAQAKALLESASLAVVPSVIAPDGSRDALPVTLMEALALELPVVASDVAGIPELVDSAVGILVSPGDERALASALAELTALPAESRAALGAAGRERARERCDVRVQTARLAGLFGLTDATSGSPKTGG